MGSIGQVLRIQDELYVVVRTLRIGLERALTSEQVDALKAAWHAEKVFKQADIYYFVNEITTIELINEQDQRILTPDSPESTPGG